MSETSIVLEQYVCKMPIHPHTFICLDDDMLVKHPHMSKQLPHICMPPVLSSKYSTVKLYGKLIQPHNLL